MSSSQKPKDDAAKLAAARVRDNQRRARERHKAYFQDLQRKVSEYEKEGVQATLQMQQAARSVAIENEGLRQLLRRKGVGENEVAAFMRDFDEGKVAPMKQTMSKCGNDVKPQGHGGARPTMSPVAHQPLPVDFTNYQPDGLAILADVSAQQKCCNGQTQCADSKDQTRAFEPIPRTTTATETSFSVPSQANDDNDLNSSTTMSCLAAAQIVADLQGHGDRERARLSLGCCDEGECTVKNTAVFQVMDSG